METVSENTPKPKRGRPKSFQRTFADELDSKGFSSPSIRTTRGKMNASFAGAFIGAWIRAAPDIQSRIMNCSSDAIKAGTHRFPRGFDTAATEIGRWIEAQHDEDEAKEAALLIVADARDEDIPWRQIRAHFRTMRLGEREGSAVSLFQHLARAFDDYRRMFPATPHTAQVAGIRNLLDAVELPAED